MKFRADAKDIFIFVLFCAFLLYAVALGVLNFSQLAQDGSFWGFNPLPAFTSDFIVATIVFYILALGIVIFSVSSYFFDREKGFGVIANKTNKGFSRWSKEKEMKAELKAVSPSSNNSAYAGVTLINDGKTLYVDDGEYHNLIIGATGSGKTQGIVLPTVKVMAKKGESMIITDPKGEIYEETGEMLRANGYNIIVLNFRNPENGNAWNPLTLPYNLYKNGNIDKSLELLDDLALNILYEEKNSNADPFWEKTSADYFTGLALGLFEDATEDKVNLNSINFMATIGEDKYMQSTYIKEYFYSKDPTSSAFINASGTINAPTDTKGSILSVFRQKLKLFASRENLSEMLAYSDIDMKSIGREKTAVFMIIQDEKKTLHPLATIFVKQCYETLIDVAQESGGKLKYRTNFILDEFANMPPLKDVTTMVTAARSRNIRFNFIIQNFAQLTQVYGKENGETIKGNCGNLIYLISSELSALEEISKMCGEVKSKEKDKTSSTPLVTVSDLQRLKMYETIILRTRMFPFKTKLTPNWQMDWGKKYPKSEYITREKRHVLVFQLKEFVELNTKKKMSNFVGTPPSPFGGNSPFGGGSPFGPPPGFGASPFAPSSSFAPNAKQPNDIDFNSKINVDDLIKKIDQKIAEIDEEEKKSQVAPLPTVEVIEKVTEPVVIEEKPVAVSLTPEAVKPEPTPLIKDARIEEKIELLEDISDDEFFDDFFLED